MVRQFLSKRTALIVMMLVASIITTEVFAQRSMRRGQTYDTSMRSPSFGVSESVVNGITGLFKKKNKKEKSKVNERSSNEVIGLQSTYSSSNEEESSEKADDDITLVVSGDGETKDKATLSALRSAIEQTYGTFVSSNTQLLNDDLIKDEVVSVSAGNVKEYHYISEREENGKYYVTVEATVSIGKLITYAKSKGSQAELAGATFAMNARMRKLNAQNANSAIRNLKEQALKIIPYIFDYSIQIRQPYRLHLEISPGHLFTTNLQTVNADITVTTNKNATELTKLMDEMYNLYYKIQKENIQTGDNYYVDYDPHAFVLPSEEAILNGFKIVDNLGEYRLIDDTDNSFLNNNSVQDIVNMWEDMRHDVNLGRKSCNQLILDNYNHYIYYDLDGRFDNYGIYKEGKCKYCKFPHFWHSNSPRLTIVTKGAYDYFFGDWGVLHRGGFFDKKGGPNTETNSHTVWSINPRNSEVMSFSVRLNYSLDELSKITDIKIIPIMKKVDY